MRCLARLAQLVERCPYKAIVRGLSPRAGMEGVMTDLRNGLFKRAQLEAAPFGGQCDESVETIRHEACSETAHRDIPLEVLMA